MSLHITYTPPTLNAALLLHAVADEAAEAMADVILAESQRLVPVDTGALKASGQVTKDGEGRAAISYGRDDGAGRNGQNTSAYAIPQHERLDYHHPNGQAKFLEEALHSKAAEAAEEALAVIRRTLH